METSEYLKYYNLGEVRAEQKITTGLVNTTYKVTMASGDFILRIYDVLKTDDQIAFEHEVLEYLSEKNFFVPRPIKMKDGDTYGKLEQYFGLFTYLPGHELRGPEVSEDNVNSVGETLGWFHEILKDYKPQNKKTAEDLSGTKDLLKKNESELRKSSYPDIDEIIKELKGSLGKISLSGKLPKGIVHSDLHERNILFRNGEVSGVLDFDNCYYGSLVIDVASQAVWWCFRDKRFNPIYFNTFINGYTSQRTLTENEREAFWEALRFSIIKLIVRALCLVYLGGVQNETYGHSADKINAEYFRAIYKTCLENEVNIKKILIKPV
ncbi:homoserine kinase [Patescibacteria group bacterium]|nr:homoserine kinase [Patescibacteria group bacterium]MBU1890648.1 homoserine kinase [Patescibacteria group bacterium]